MFAKVRPDRQCFSSIKTANDWENFGKVVACPQESSTVFKTRGWNIKFKVSLLISFPHKANNSIKLRVLGNNFPCSNQYRQKRKEKYCVIERLPWDLRNNVDQSKNVNYTTNQSKFKAIPAKAEKRAKTLAFFYTKFCEGRKPGLARENASMRTHNKLNINSEIQAWVTFVGSECFHHAHCAVPVVLYIRLSTLCWYGFGDLSEEKELRIIQE